MLTRKDEVRSGDLPRGSFRGRGRGSFSCRSHAVDNNDYNPVFDPPMHKVKIIQSANKAYEDKKKQVFDNVEAINEENRQGVTVPDKKPLPNPYHSHYNHDYNNGRKTYYGDNNYRGWRGGPRGFYNSRRGNRFAYRGNTRGRGYHVNRYTPYENTNTQRMEQMERELKVLRKKVEESEFTRRVQLEVQHILNKK